MRTGDPETRGHPSTPGPSLRVIPWELKSHLLLGGQPGGPRDHEPTQTSVENRPPRPLPQVHGVLTTARRLPSPSQAAPSGTQKPVPSKSCGGPGQRPPWASGTLAARPRGPGGSSADTRGPRTATCFCGHADHALLLLPEADVAFKRQEVKKQLEDDRTAMSPPTVG